MFDVILAVCFALLILIGAMAFCGALYGLGLWGIWWILVEFGVVAVTPTFWPCWAIGSILWLMLGGSKTVTIKK